MDEGVIETGMSQQELKRVEVIALRRSEQITQAEAARRLGVTERQVRRLEAKVGLALWFLKGLKRSSTFAVTAEAVEAHHTPQFHAGQGKMAERAATKIACHHVP